MPKKNLKKIHENNQFLPRLTLISHLTLHRRVRFNALLPLAAVAAMTTPQVSMASEVSEAEFLAQLQAVEATLVMSKSKRIEQLIALSKQGNIAADMTLYRYKNRGDAIDYSPNTTKVRDAIRLLNSMADDDKGLVSQFKSINYYYGNLGISKDLKKVVKFSLESAEKGNTDAMENLAYLYKSGEGVAQNYQQAMQWYRKAADAGNADSMNNIGLMYEKGQGVAKNQKTALQWYQKAADAGSYWGMSNLGLYYRDGKGGLTQDYAKAMQWYQKSADAGNADAMNSIGLMYEKGQGVAKNEETAVQWYQKAANEGSDWGMNNLGSSYRNGDGGLKQDYAKAMQWYRKAADAGNADSMNSIGRMYEKGQGVAKDEKTAVRWYQKAADAGDDWGMNNLGVYYRNGKGGLSQDYAKAMQWFQKSAGAGNASAMNSIGVMYAEGQGVAKDEKTAVQWYQKAANEGDEWGMHNLALYYRDGKGGLTQDYKQAMQWYQKSADLNNGRAMSEIGRLYERGQGVGRNYKTAEQWYQKAIEAGDEYGYIAMAELYHGELNDSKQAKIYYEKAAELDYFVAMSSLGLFYEYGHGLPVDYNKAAHWYSKSLSVDHNDTIYYTDSGDLAETHTRKKLENLLATGKITDPAIRKQVESIFAKPPLVTWQSAPPSTTTDDKVSFSVLLTDQGGGIGNVRVLLNGVPVDQATTRGIGRDVKQNSKRFDLTLPQGTHTITVDAMPADNIGIPNKVSKTITSTFKQVDKPKLHAVVVGINQFSDSDFNLKYASQDAKAVYEQLNQQTNGIYAKGNMQLLTSKTDTSKQNILATLEQVKASTKMNDVFVFYVASHGFNFNNSGYHLLTSNVDDTNEKHLSKAGISSIELQDALAEITTNKKLVILDTCDSGGALIASDLMRVGSRGMDEQRFTEDLNRKSGVTVLMASSSREKALEGYQGHGLFTYSILQALKGEADVNRDGMVKTPEMAEYVSESVKSISRSTYNKEQKPKMSIEGDGFEFMVF